MKNLMFLIFVLAIVSLSTGQKTLANLSAQKINNEHVMIESMLQQEMTIIAFWATWCLPCIEELNGIHDYYSNWQEEFDLKIIAISIDDYRTISRVRPMVKANEWNFEILLDKNQDFKRALQISNIPYVLIVKGQQIVYQHAGYVPGYEELLYSKIKEFSN